MIRALAAAILLAGCAAGGMSAPDELPMEVDPCDVEIQFGSFAMGIDQDLRARVVAMVEAEPDATSEEAHWGREGESTICVMTSDARVTDRLYVAIAAMIPEHSERAPTTVTHRDGRSRASTWPERP